MRLRTRPTRHLAAAAAATLCVAAVWSGAGPAFAHQMAPAAPAAAPHRVVGAPVPVFDDYLALGDSLGAGFQPDSAGQGVITDQGYANDLAARLQAHDKRLKFVDLACPDDTTTTMLDGGCPFPEPYASQIDAATAFLTAHRAARVLVTIDIGANDVDPCASTTGLNETCVEQGLQSIGINLPVILAKLKAAAGPHTEIIGMNYYDPFLAAWLAGAAGQAEAQASETLVADLNGVLAQAFGGLGIPVADVSASFDTASFAPLVPISPSVTVPLNVARVCAWTWMCAAAPVGPNIHPNATGYRVIAQAFNEVLAHR